jgi:transposase
MNLSLKSLKIWALIPTLFILDTWVHNASKSKGNTNVASNESNENEIKRLKKQVLRLAQERDILKKAAAYFAQEIV